MAAKKKTSSAKSSAKRASRQKTLGKKKATKKRVAGRTASKAETGGVPPAAPDVEEPSSDSGREGLAVDITDPRQAEQAVVESEQRLRIVADNVPVILFEADPGGAITYFSPAWERLTGRPAEEALGQGWVEFIHPDDLQRVQQIWAEVRTQEETGTSRHRLRAADGSYRWCHAQATPVKDEAGNVVRWFGSLADIDELIRAEQELHALNEQLEERVAERSEQVKRLVEEAPDAIVLVNRQGEMLQANRKTEELFGYSAQELRGQAVEMLVPESLRQRHGEHRERYFQDARPRPMGIGLQLTGKCKDGHEIPVEIQLNPFEFDGETVTAAAIRDITERKQLEQTIAVLAEEERQRMGRELHDTLGQQITGLGMLATSLRRSLAEAGDNNLVDRLQEGLEAAKLHVRQLMKGLSPVDVDAGGLKAALEELAQETGELYSVDCVVETPGPVSVEDNFTATQLFLVAREAVHNAVKHGTPKRVTIRLERNEQTLDLSVRDDGAGLRLRALTEGGHGIHIMRYRCGLVGGILSIDPLEEGGTVIRCLVRGN